MSGRSAIAVAALPALLLAGCGGSDGGGGTTGPSAAPAKPATAERTIPRDEAEAQAGSAAAQDSVRQDYSIPPTAFVVRCVAPGGATTAGRWTCAARSRDGRCRGSLTLVVLVDGATRSRGELLCRGPRE